MSILERLGEAVSYIINAVVTYGVATFLLILLLVFGPRG